LRQELLVLAREWPLSSAGIRDVGPVDVKAFIGHSGLRQLYIDRIIAYGDVTRLNEPMVELAARHALGAFPELCQPIADHFQIQNSAQPSEEPTAAET